MSCATPRTVCQIQSWKRPVDCTTFETRTQSGGSRTKENLIPEKVYYSAPLGSGHRQRTEPAHLRLWTAEVPEPRHLGRRQAVGGGGSGGGAGLGPKRRITPAPLAEKKHRRS